MLTHTPLDATSFGSVLAALRSLPIVLCALCIAVVAATALYRRALTRGLFGGICFFVGIAALWVLQVVGARQSQDFVRSQFAERLAAATALFEQRCKTAGEQVVRTAVGVEGIELLNVRPPVIDMSDQFRMDDPYGRNCSGGEDCIAVYLFDYKMLPVPGSNGSVAPFTPRLYQYVDVVDSTNGSRTRYTKTGANAPLVPASAAATEALPKFGVRWLDISTREDREHWIAGGSIQVIDLAKDEVIAERKGYVMDPGQGSRDGFRSPWAWATRSGQLCPDLWGHNQAFVSKVLSPVDRGQK